MQKLRLLGHSLACKSLASQQHLTYQLGLNQSACRCVCSAASSRLMACIAALRSNKAAPCFQASPASPDHGVCFWEGIREREPSHRSWLSALWRPVLDCCLPLLCCRCWVETPAAASICSICCRSSPAFLAFGSSAAGMSSAASILIGLAADQVYLSTATMLKR